jgi:hypothetical protein
VLAAQYAFLMFTEGYRQEQQQSTAESEQDTGMQLRRLLAEWADSTVPLLLRFMTRLLHRAQQEASGSVSATGCLGATGNNSSGCGGCGDAGGNSSGCGGCGDAGGNSSGGAASLPALLDALYTCVQLLSELGVGTAMRVDSSGVAAVDCVWDPVWDNNRLEVVHVFECYVRLLLSLQGSEHAVLARQSSLAVLHCMFNSGAHRKDNSLGVLVMLASSALVAPAQVQRCLRVTASSRRPMWSGS